LLERVRTGSLTARDDSFYASNATEAPDEPQYHVVSASPIRVVFDSNYDIRGPQAIYYDPAFFAAHPGTYVAKSQSQNNASPKRSSDIYENGPINCIELGSGYGVCTFSNPL
jgi:hypothetical protein